MKKFACALVWLAVCCGSVQALDTSCLQISLWAPKVQLVNETVDIYGLKLNLLYGGNERVVGLDAGLFSNNESVSALQANIFMNRTREHFAGLQAGIYNGAASSSGIKIGLVNRTEGINSGVSVGLLWNSSLENRGVTIGLINYTEFLTGLQIGLINIATKSTVPFFPILNFCF